MKEVLSEQTHCSSHGVGDGGREASLVLMYQLLANAF
jgi:hypothetical protein